MDSLAYAIDSGWLPDPRANAEQDVGSTVTAEELEEMGSAASNRASGAWCDLPACFAGCGTVQRETDWF